MFADVVFTGGGVFIADAVRSRASAAAIRDGRIIAVGHDLTELVGPRTEVVDLRGGLLIPGFQDAHVHPLWGGLNRIGCDLSAYRTQKDYLTEVGRYAQSRRGDPWVTGGGWSMAAFPGGTPTASALDSVVGERPTVLTNRDGHGAWVNSSALRAAGITRESPDPADGRIERDGAGNPTGTLHEGAMDLVTRLLPPVSPQRLVEGLLEGQRHLHSCGVTAWQDAIVGSYGGIADPGPTYAALGNDGRLTARVVGAIWWDREQGLEQIGSILERRERYRGGRFAATSVKVMQDGVVENFTASMLDPYYNRDGCCTHNAGISFIDPDLLAQVVQLLDAHGFQVHFHAIGDRAVRQCLNAVEAAVARNGLRDNRHHIAHVQVVHPRDLPRFRALGVAANLQTLWAALGPQMMELTIPFLGESRITRQYPFGDLLRSGAVLAAGSDWPVSSSNPLAAIHTAVNRTVPSGAGDSEQDAFLPEQRVDLASALIAYTAGSAWVNHLDAVSGSITVGKYADLAVLNRDPFVGAMNEIGTTRVLQTFVQGERVFAADDA